MSKSASKIIGGIFVFAILALVLYRAGEVSGIINTLGESSVNFLAQAQGSRSSGGVA